MLEEELVSGPLSGDALVHSGCHNTWLLKGMFLLGRRGPIGITGQGYWQTEGPVSL